MRSMPRGAVQRRERGDEHHRRAVRARRDALRQVAQVLGVDLGDDERDVGVHPERGGVVDDLRARRPRRPAPTRARSGRRRPRSRGRARRSTRAPAPRRSTSPPANGRLAALGARRRVDAQPVHRERALLEDPQHLLADQAGRADDPDVRRPSSTFSSSNAECSARTAALDVGLLHHARDPDRRRADHLDVHALVARAPRTSSPRHRGSSSCPRRRA